MDSIKRTPFAVKCALRTLTVYEFVQNVNNIVTICVQKVAQLRITTA